MAQWGGDTGPGGMSFAKGGWPFLSWVAHAKRCTYKSVLSWEVGSLGEDVDKNSKTARRMQR